MSCRELVEVITDYIDGALPPAERRRLEAHLEECPPCVIYVGQMRQTIAAIGELREEWLEPDARDQLVDAFRGWAAERA